MCRAKRSAQPLDDVALQLEALIDEAISRPSALASPDSG